MWKKENYCGIFRKSDVTVLKIKEYKVGLTLNGFLLTAMNNKALKIVYR